MQCSLRKPSFILEFHPLAHITRCKPALSIRHSCVHKKEKKQSDHNQDHPHDRPNNQTGHISKGVGSMIGYYEYLKGYAQDYR
jgi:hypothetical protein